MESGLDIFISNIVKKSNSTSLFKFSKIKNKVYEFLGTMYFDQEYSFIDIFTKIVNDDKKFIVEYHNNDDMFFIYNIILFIECSFLVKILKLSDNEYNKKTFIPIMILFLSEKMNIKNKKYSEKLIISLLVFTSLTIDLSKKSRDFVPEIITSLNFVLAYLKDNMVINNDLNNEKLNLNTIIEDLIHKNENISLLNILNICLDLIKINKTIINNDPNFDILIKISLDLLNDFKMKLNNENISVKLAEIINNLTQISNESKLKIPINIIKDQPLLKIKQLTPRIEYSGKNMKPVETQKEKINKLKSQVFII